MAVFGSTTHPTTREFTGGWLGVNKVTIPAGSTLRTIHFYASAITSGVELKAVVYSHTGTQAGTLLTTSNAESGFTAAGEYGLALLTPQTFGVDTEVWIGIQNSTAANFTCGYRSGSPISQVWLEGDASGAMSPSNPAPMSSGSAGGSEYAMWGSDVALAPSARVTQLPVMTLGLSPSDARVTQLPVMALAMAPSDARVSQIAVMTLGDYVENPWKANDLIITKWTQ